MRLSAAASAPNDPMYMEGVVEGRGACWYASPPLLGLTPKPWLVLNGLFSSTGRSGTRFELVSPPLFQLDGSEGANDSLLGSGWPLGNSGGGSCTPNQ